jgi:phosphoenolpyruvate carboxykinase (ATP)
MPAVLAVFHKPFENRGRRIRCVLVGLLPINQFEGVLCFLAVPLLKGYLNSLTMRAIITILLLVVCAVGQFTISQGFIQIDAQGNSRELGDKTIHWNSVAAELYEIATIRGEGVITADGPLAVKTQPTGRVPDDKYIVKDSLTEDNVWWAKNKPLTPEKFDLLRADMLAHLRREGSDVFVQDLFGGADPASRIGVRVVTELAWQALFIQNLLRVPTAEERAGFAADFTIIDSPSFFADTERHGTRSSTVVALDFSRKVVLIAGTSYAGEIKKSVFTILNYILPTQGVMPMHCSVNVGADGESAVFFGLSGTGKTTLSADPHRPLLGDDEHGWSNSTVFNFEGGCYAKMIKLSAEAEPEIFATTKRFGTVLENVVVDPVTRQLDLDDNSLTENTRGAYPLSFIPNSLSSGIAGVPTNIIMLTADAFGVMPPIAKLTPSQAMYHFLSGYTAKVAGTEKGLGNEPQATFSTCFGAPFMPRHPSVYGNLLRQKIAAGNVSCWLVNTGWTGGAFGTGKRMPIKVTRALVTAAIDGSLQSSDMRTDENFGFEVPTSVHGVPDELLNPRTTWADGSAYDAQAQKLVNMFVSNFKTYENYVSQDVLDASPRIAK